MRISDWSSDVCSSDVIFGFDAQAEMAELFGITPDVDGELPDMESRLVRIGQHGFAAVRQRNAIGVDHDRRVGHVGRKIGRASCRERGGPYVSISVGGVSLKTKKRT